MWMKPYAEDPRWARSPQQQRTRDLPGHKTLRLARPFPAGFALKRPAQIEDQLRPAVRHDPLRFGRWRSIFKHPEALYVSTQRTIGFEFAIFHLEWIRLEFYCCAPSITGISHKAEVLRLLLPV